MNDTVIKRPCGAVLKCRYCDCNKTKGTVIERRYAAVTDKNNDKN